MASNLPPQREKPHLLTCANFRETAVEIRIQIHGQSFLSGSASDRNQNKMSASVKQDSKVVKHTFGTHP